MVMGMATGANGGCHEREISDLVLFKQNFFGADPEFDQSETPVSLLIYGYSNNCFRRADKVQRVHCVSLVSAPDSTTNQQQAINKKGTNRDGPSGPFYIAKGPVVADGLNR